MSASAPAILVLGVGNLLLRDEGLGVHVIRALASRSDLPPNVTLLDGGTLGPLLLDAILNCEYLILIDVARAGLPAGTLSRKTGNEILGLTKAKQSAHEWSISEVLQQAHLLGQMPATTALLVEPQDVSTFDTELSPALAARLPAIAAAVMDEIACPAGRPAP
jgi:hydrogenase maturation protease